MKTKIFIGTSGWSYFHWKNRFYPQELSSYRWLEYYAKYFSTAEVNMTFYRIPKESMLKNWYRRTPQNFTFTFKANRMITHVKKLRNVKKLIKQFYALASVLKEKLACILFQLPPSMKFDEEKLKDFLSQLDTKYKNVIEFRHESWWNKKTYELMKNKATFCIVSAPHLPEDFVLTNKIAYVRFHGKRSWYGSNYSNAELKEWAAKIKKATKKCSEIYTYFNNDYNAYAVFNAMELKKILK